MSPSTQQEASINRPPGAHRTIRVGDNDIFLSVSLNALSTLSSLFPYDFLTFLSTLCFMRAFDDISKWAGRSSIMLSNIPITTLDWRSTLVWFAWFDTRIWDPRQECRPLSRSARYRISRGSNLTGQTLCLKCRFKLSFLQSDRVIHYLSLILPKHRAIIP